MTQAGATKCSSWNRVDRVVRQILARDPVDRRVEVRAGVLAAREVVPVPARAARVVGRDLLDPERPTLAHLGRQRDLRKVGRERLRQVDDADAPAGERRGELGEERRSNGRKGLGLLRRDAAGGDGGGHGPNGRTACVDSASTPIVVSACRKRSPAASWASETYSSAWCAWAMCPGPHTTVGMPARWNRPASVPNATSVVASASARRPREQHREVVVARQERRRLADRLEADAGSRARPRASPARATRRRRAPRPASSATSAFGRLRNS